MSRQFFSGTSLEQAVMSAARHFGLEPDQVAYKVRDKKHGFLKVRRRLVIEVDPDAPRRAETEKVAPLPPPVTPPPPPAAKPSSWTDPRGPANRGGEERQKSAEKGRGNDEGVEAQALEDDEIEDEGVDRVDRVDDVDGVDDADRGFDIESEEDEAFYGLEEDFDGDEFEAVEESVLELLCFLRLDAEMAVEEGEDGVFEVELSDVGRKYFVEREGRILHAMDYLVPRLVRGLTDHGVPCRVDFGGFRVEHEESLQNLARQVADELRHEGGSRVLDAMNPADRRMIHIALADDPEIETVSLGNGYYKKVKILSTQDDETKSTP